MKAGFWTGQLLPALLAGQAMVAPANAAPMPYIGTWATIPPQCRLDQSAEDAPLVMTDKGFDQNEIHCSFKSLRREAETWKARAECSVQGGKQPLDLAFSVEAGQLVLRFADGPAQQYGRCPSPG